MKVPSARPKTEDDPRATEGHLCGVVTSFSPPNRAAEMAAVEAEEESRRAESLSTFQSEHDLRAGVDQGTAANGATRQ